MSLTVYSPEIRRAWGKNNGNKIYEIVSFIKSNCEVKYIIFKNKQTGLNRTGRIGIKIAEDEAFHWPRLHHRSLAVLLEVININKNLSIYMTSFMNLTMRCLITQHAFICHSDCFNRKKKYAEDVLLGIEYLHRRSLCLFNVGDENILISLNENKAVIADLSYLKMVTKDSTYEVDLFNVPFLYRAPEINNKKLVKRPLASEMWSVGILMMELFLSYKVPWYLVGFNTSRALEILSKMDDEVLEITNEGSIITPNDTDAFKTFISSFIRKNSQNRCYAIDAASSTFLRSANKSICQQDYDIFSEHHYSKSIRDVMKRNAENRTIVSSNNSEIEFQQNSSPIHCKYTSNEPRLLLDEGVTLHPTAKHFYSTLSNKDYRGKNHKGTFKSRKVLSSSDANERDPLFFNSDKKEEINNFKSYSQQMSEGSVTQLDRKTNSSISLSLSIPSCIESSMSLNSWDSKKSAEKQNDNNINSSLYPATLKIKDMVNAYEAGSIERQTFSKNIFHDKQNVNVVPLLNDHKRVTSFSLSNYPDTTLDFNLHSQLKHFENDIISDESVTAFDKFEPLPIDNISKRVGSQNYPPNFHASKKISLNELKLRLQNLRTFDEPTNETTDCSDAHPFSSTSVSEEESNIVRNAANDENELDDGDIIQISDSKLDQTTIIKTCSKEIIPDRASDTANSKIKTEYHFKKHTGYRNNSNIPSSVALKTSDESMDVADYNDKHPLMETRQNDIKKRYSYKKAVEQGLRFSKQGATNYDQSMEKNQQMIDSTERHECRCLQCQYQKIKDYENANKSQGLSNRQKCEISKYLLKARIESEGASESVLPDESNSSKVTKEDSQRRQILLDDRRMLDKDKKKKARSKLNCFC